MATETKRTYTKSKKTGTISGGITVKREKKKIKAGSGGGKGKTIDMSRQESIYDSKGNRVGSLFYDTDYTKAAGPKGFGKKSKYVVITGSKAKKLKSTKSKKK